MVVYFGTKKKKEKNFHNTRILVQNDGSGEIRTVYIPHFARILIIVGTSRIVCVIRKMFVGVLR